jgi:hypothetical protein
MDDHDALLITLFTTALASASSSESYRFLQTAVTQAAHARKARGMGVAEATGEIRRVLDLARRPEREPGRDIFLQARVVRWIVAAYLPG